MTDIEVYARQVCDALEQVYRTPEFNNRVAFMAGLRGILKPDRFGRA